MRDIHATLMRGGTSKCWVFEHDALAVPGRGVDEVLLRLYGSPDPRQLDGVGGATSTTSKAVLLAPSARPDADVDYTFAQVGISDGRVDWTSNCGNCSAVVGPYALRRGWVAPTGDVTEVRVHNTNTDQLIVLEVATPGGEVQEEGDVVIPGVATPGLGVRMWFVDPGGRTTGALWPSGRTTDEIDGVPVTLVDAGAPVVVVPAPAVGLTGRESVSEIDADPALLARLDGIRRRGAVLMGLAAAPEQAARATPKLALAAAGVPGRSDLTIRMLSMGRAHPALAVTGSIALTLAAREPGTVLADLVSGDRDTVNLDMDTPAGVVSTAIADREGRTAVGVWRTARRLADALLALPEGTPRTHAERPTAGAAHAA